MTSFFQRFFSGAARTNKFPKISWGHRFEGIEYETEKNSIYIDSTFIDGRKIYTDSIKAWKDNTPISQVDKANIFKEVLEFATKKSGEKPIIVINIDDEKTFWEALCKESSQLIKEIQYESNQQKEEFHFNNLLDNIRKNGTLIFGDKTITTEAELLEYWKHRKDG